VVVSAVGLSVVYSSYTLYFRCNSLSSELYYSMLLKMMMEAVGCWRCRLQRRRGGVTSLVSHAIPSFIASHVSRPVVNSWLQSVVPIAAPDRRDVDVPSLGRCRRPRHSTRTDISRNLLTKSSQLARCDILVSAEKSESLVIATGLTELRDSRSLRTHNSEFSNTQVRPSLNKPTAVWRISCDISLFRLTIRSGILDFWK